MKKLFTVLSILMIIFFCCSCSVETPDPIPAQTPDPIPAQTTDPIPAQTTNGPCSFPSPHQFEYNYRISNSADLFVDWLSSGGTLIVNEKNYSEYDCNRPILDWAKTKNNIVLPTSKIDGCTFYRVRTFSSAPAYRIRFVNDEDKIWIRVTLSPLTEEQQKSNIVTLANEFLEKTEDEYQKGFSDKWGEYVYIANEMGTYFIYDDYFIYLHVIVGDEEWSPEHLNYIDFEYVPLEREQTGSQETE